LQRRERADLVRIEPRNLGRADSSYLLSRQIGDLFRGETSYDAHCISPEKALIRLLSEKKRCDGPNPSLLVSVSGICAVYLYLFATTRGADKGPAHTFLTSTKLPTLVNRKSFIAYYKIN
jgi:hypothetical protein